MITTNSTDLYGGFPTVPTINGYAYAYSVKLGSNATSYDLHSTSSNPGGFSRSITYSINVPAGSTAIPYTMTYAHAMVLENGTHNPTSNPCSKPYPDNRQYHHLCITPVLPPNVQQCRQRPGWRWWRYRCHASIRLQPSPTAFYPEPGLFLACRYSR